MRHAWAAALAAAVLAVAAGCEQATTSTGRSAAPGAGAKPSPRGDAPAASRAGPAAAPSQPPPAKADPDPDPFPGEKPAAKDAAEPLPEAPRLDPRNAHVALNREKTFLAEQTPDKKFVRVLLAAEVCLREGPLEVFLCRKNTKEHEAVVRVDLDAKLIHAALVAAGGKPGSPARFVNPDTDKPEYRPAHGTKVRVLVHYRRDGRLHTHPAQEWVWDRVAKRPAAHDWVFAGSVELKDPDRPDAPPFYGANTGEVISVSNFPYSMLDFPVQVGREDAALSYEARAAMIPPVLSKVWVILEPQR